MPRVTVIMPSLNVSKYIKLCIESVLTQTLQDIEILVIDAGSTDGTLEILQKYAEFDNRIKIIHSDRKSYGYQINKGILLSQAEYVGIVETDDMIVPDMFETLYDVALKEKAEFVKGRAEKVVEIADDFFWENPMGTPLSNTYMLGALIEPKNMSELLVNDLYLWNGIYRKDFISKIRLNETLGAAFQDQGFICQTICFASRAVYIDKVVYKYRQDNSNSSIFNRKGFEYLVKEYSYVEQFIRGKDRVWISAYYQRMLNQCLARFRIMAVSGEFWEEASLDMETLRRKLLQAVENQFIQSEDVDELKWEMLKVFLAGAKEIFSYYVDEFRKKTNQVLEIFQTIADKQTIIFGGGTYGKFFHALLECKRPGLAVAFCDNNSKLWDNEIQGKVVLSPNQAVDKYPNAMYVIANLKSADAIKQQLIDLGIVDEQICIWQVRSSILLFNADI